MPSTKRALSELDEDVQVSYKRLCTIKKSNLDISKKMKSIDRQIELLYYKRNRYMQRRFDLMRGPLEDVLVPYSRAWTLAFVTRMRDRLPRELRDLIYSHAWQKMAQKTAILSTFEDLIRLPRCMELPCQCFRARKLPSLIDPACVGWDVALEAGEAFYKSRPASARYKLSHLAPLICNDVFHLGVDPATVLRGVSIDIRAEDQTNQVAFQGELLPLLQIQNRSGFELHLTISQRVVRLKVVGELLDTMRPIVRELKKHGANVNVGFAYRNITTFYPSTQYDLNDAIDAPHGTWKEGMLMWLGVQDYIWPHHREYIQEDEPGYFYVKTYGDSSEDEDMYSSEDD